MQNYPEKYYASVTNSELSFKGYQEKSNISTNGKFLKADLPKARHRGEGNVKTEDLDHIQQSSGIQTKDICAVDNRSQVDNFALPYRLICELQIIDGLGYPSRGTGFFISPRCIITAGHCVFDRGRKWSKEIMVYPGSKGTKAPFGSARSTAFRTVEGWIFKSFTNFDYGAVFLDSDELYNNIRGYFGFKEITDQKELLLNSGYPKDKKSVQVKDTGYMEPNTDMHRLPYLIDTNKGSSGSPVLTNSNGNYNVVGVHTKGGCPNSAIKVNKDVMQVWRNWKSESINEKSIL